MAAERNWRGKVRPCPQCRRRRRWLATAAASAVLAAVTSTGVVAPAHSFPVAGRAQPAAPVQAVLASSTESVGGRILDAAETRTGDWYAWGGAGPSVFDCSGLVVWAAARYGIYLPHNTVAMLSSPHLYRVYTPQRGDLAFFGTGHVELVTIWYHQTFGAHHSGTRVGWSYYDPRYYGPTAFYRIR